MGITSNLHIDETRTLPCGAKVKRYQIATTALVIYAAYEPTGPRLGGDGRVLTPWSHHSVTRIDDVYFGHVGTADLPDELNALPGLSRERSDAVGAWYKSEWARAHALILQAFPEAASGRRSDGDIELVWNTP